MAISPSSFAARSSRPPARKASTDDHLVVGELPSPRLLRVLDGVQRHPERVATQGVARPHGGRDVGMESFSKGHRIGTSSPDGAGRLVDAGAIPDRPVEPPVSRS
jgi:hypothetical protein